MANTLAAADYAFFANDVYRDSNEVDLLPAKQPAMIFRAFKKRDYSKSLTGISIKIISMVENNGFDFPHKY